jgi:hypothetical protein
MPRGADRGADPSHGQLVAGRAADHGEGGVGQSSPVRGGIADEVADRGSRRCARRRTSCGSGRPASPCEVMGR